MFRKTILSLSTLAALCTMTLAPAFAEEAQAPVPGASVTVAPAAATSKPKGEAALKSVLDELLQGKSDFAAIAPMTRLNLLQQRGMIPALSMRLQSFGALQTISFAGTQNGMEVYDVRFAEASMVWGVAPGPDGSINHIRWIFH